MRHNPIYYSLFSSRNLLSRREKFFHISGQSKFGQIAFYSKTAQNCYDLATKFPTLHPYNCPKLDSIKFIVSSNSLPSNPKLYYLLSNMSQGITGQLPAIIKAKKSVASFKLRKNSPVAIFTTLRKHKALALLNNLTLFYLPLLVSLGGAKLNLTSPNNKKVLKHSLQHSLKHSYSFGFNNMSYLSYIQLPTRGSGLVNDWPSATTKSTDSGEIKTSLEEGLNETVGKNIGGYVQLNTLFFNHSSSEKFSLLVNSFYVSLLIPYPFSYVQTPLQPVSANRGNETTNNL